MKVQNMLKIKQNIEKISQSVLNKYFAIDGKTATIDLYFDTFAELIDQNVGNNNVEMLNGTLFGKIDEIFAIIPKKYDIEINLHIKDFGEYTAEETEKIIKENVDLKVLAFMLERRRKNITGLSLLGIGAAMLLVSYFLSRLSWPQIIFDIINISGTLFVWEAVDIALIERGIDTKRAKQYVKKFKALHVLNN